MRTPEETAREWLEKNRLSVNQNLRFLTNMLFLRDAEHATVLRDAVARARREALRLDQPWPMVDILSKLVAAVHHLLSVHHCDHHGWEQDKAAVDAAFDAIAALKEPDHADR